jgi:tetratricopeptide (TPR) repeat protein
MQPLDICLLALAFVSGGEPQHSHSMASESRAPAPLLRGLGDLHHPVTTSNPLAQRYFDQGLALIYGFNHEEAARSFRYAAELDPKCAMAYWGVALAVGPNYNEPVVDLSREKAAIEALEKAAAAAPASPAEQAYIQALAKRYSADPKADRKRHALAYKAAMEEVMKNFPDDLDAAVLFADAAMDLHPWQLWKADGQPEEGTPAILDALGTVLKRAPDHVGANHLYIHATEASPNPEQAIRSAERLPSLAPAAGHLVHMPSHVYIRTGDYHSASDANQKAADVDAAYVDKYRVTGMYPAMYYTHNLHFLAISASMEGRSADADRAAARLLDEATPHLKVDPMVETFIPTRALVLVRARKWDEVRKLPEPDKNLKAAHAFWRFSRAMAFSASGQFDQAASERNALSAEAGGIDAAAMHGFNSARRLLELAQLLVDASVARGQRQFKQSAALLERAAQIEDALNYNEPPDWYLPPRESLGAVLLQDGRFPEAEAAFRSELKVHARNPRALFGLAEALKAQGKTTEEAHVRKQFNEAWRHADLTLRIEDL